MQRIKGSLKLRVKHRVHDYVIQAKPKHSWMTICDNDRNPVIYSSKQEAIENMHEKLAHIYNKLPINN